MGTTFLWLVTTLQTEISAENNLISRERLVQNAPEIKPLAATTSAPNGPMGLYKTTSESPIVYILSYSLYV